MTIIAAIFENGKGAIAADTTVTTGAWMGSSVQTLSGKVWRHGPVLLGFAGASVYLRWWWERNCHEMTTHPHLVPERWALAAQEAFAAHWSALGHGKVGDDGVRTFDANLLMVCADGVFWLSPDGGVHLMDDGYSAIGCGRDHALGAFYALTRSKDAIPELETEDKARLAAQAATRHAVGCGGHVETLEL